MELIKNIFFNTDKLIENSVVKIYNPLFNKVLYFLFCLQQSEFKAPVLLHHKFPHRFRELPV